MILGNIDAKSANFHMKLPTILSSLVLALGLTCSASAVTINWNGSTDFNDNTITFSGFTANTLTDITGSGTLSSGRNVGLVTGYLDLYINGSWVNIWSGSVDDDWHTANPSSISLASILTPITFTSGTITGLRLTSNPNGDVHDGNGYNYNDVGGWNCQSDTSFIFNTVTSNTPIIPTPDAGSSIVLLGSALAALGFIARRR
jgi:hypothetical protein